MHACWIVENPNGDDGSKSILVAGGLTTFVKATITSGSFNIGLNSTEIYSFDTNTWTFGIQLPDQRSDGRAVTIQSRHLWFGGRLHTGSTRLTNSIWEYSSSFGWKVLNWSLPMNTSIPVLIPYNI